MKYLIYLVEDEENLNQLLTSYLKNEGWEVYSFLPEVKLIKILPKNLTYGY